MMSNLFKVIYADPPWAFEVWGKSNGRSASDKYPVLSRDAYNRIERLLDGAYCELFARSRRPGWTQLGNAMSGLDIRDEMPAVIRQQQSQEAV